MTLLTIETADHVTTLTLNRPDSMNPLGAAGDGDAFVEACDAINARARREILAAIHATFA